MITAEIATASKAKTAVAAGANENAAPRVAGHIEHENRAEDRDGIVPAVGGDDEGLAGLIGSDADQALVRANAIRVRAVDATGPVCRAGRRWILAAPDETTR